MRFFHIPKIIRQSLYKLKWHVPVESKICYLTFDDGPTEEVTPFILKQLLAFNAKATFFCVGENVRKHPALYKQILNAGHSTGNHTQHHLNGWKSTTAEYVSDVLACSEFVKSKLFRPPYGKIKPAQCRKLKEAGFDIIMWSELTYDFDGKVSAEHILKKMNQYISPGSIVVMHDHLKAYKNLNLTLPLILKNLSLKGYKFKAL